MKMLMNYGSQGLRALDSIQLSTAISLKSIAALSLSVDRLLESFLMQESFNTKSPLFNNKAVKALQILQWVPSCRKNISLDVHPECQNHINNYRRAHGEK
jgi:hypothetical protein